MATTRLEAIMFTDIAGYSRMMEADEDRTIELLRTHNEIVFPIIDAHSGQVVASIGDGLFVVFPTVRQAVGCALAVHQAVAAHNETAPATHGFKLRVGIHLGEVHHDGNQAYGAGVNVAARVQPFAFPGGICITEDVFRQIESRFPNQTVNIGRQSLRNISKQHQLFRLITGHEDANQELESEVQQRHPDDRGADAPGSPPAVAAKPSGELDEIKERILTEIEKWSSKHSSTGSTGHHRAGHHPGTSDGGAEVGSKVFGAVERIMDKAIQKWDEMPEEKRANIIEKITTGIEQSDQKKEEKAASSIAGEISWGAAATLGFGLWYAQAGSVWMIVVGVLVGVLPLISGIQKLVKRRLSKRKRRGVTPSDLEGIALKAAKELGGRVTVVQMAAHIGRPLEEVQRVLDDMTSKGYVSLEILDNGVIRYDFPSLFSDDSNPKPIR